MVGGIVVMVLKQADWATWLPGTSQVGKSIHTYMHTYSHTYITPYSLAS